MAGVAGRMTLAGVREAWRDRSIVPYLVLLASPVLSFPISLWAVTQLQDCAEDEVWWKLSDFELALLPGLLDLVPFLWVLSRTVSVRRAAITAGVIGAIRLAIPQALTLSYAAQFSAEDAACNVSVFLAVGLFPIMLGLWAASAVIVALVLLARGKPAGGSASA